MNISTTIPSIQQGRNDPVIRVNQLQQLTEHTHEEWTYCTALDDAERGVYRQARYYSLHLGFLAAELVSTIAGRPTAWSYSCECEESIATSNTKILHATPRWVTHSCQIISHAQDNTQQMVYEASAVMHSERANKTHAAITSTLK